MAFEENTYWKNVLIIVPAVGAGVATIIYLLRLYVHHQMRRVGFLLEDALMGIGLLLSYCHTGFSINTAFHGIGMPLDSLPPHERYNLQFSAWMTIKFWGPAMAFIKISIILFLKRLLGTVRSYSIISYCLIVFIILWAITILFVNIFQCSPIKYFYDQSSPGHCIKGQVAFYQANGSIALVQDVIVLCMPIPIIWRLQITSRQKAALTFVFSLGGLVCIFSLLRLVEFRNFKVADLAASSAREFIWTCLEINFCIICGCLPMLKPLFVPCLGKSRTKASKSHSQTSSAFKNGLFHSSFTTHQGFFHLGSSSRPPAGSENCQIPPVTSRIDSDVQLQESTTHPNDLPV